VSLTVVFRETALRALARVRSDGKEAFAQIRRAIAALAGQPHPVACRGRFLGHPVTMRIGSGG
jgi:hypothetical protein